MSLREWIEKNKLNCEWIEDQIFRIDGKIFYHLKDRDQLFTDKFQFKLTEYEKHFVDYIDYFVFKFGSRYYYSEPNKPELNVFKYLGTHCAQCIPFPFLGIHGKFEICNGSRDYSDWITKAKFLGISVLGICEKNTLAGTVAFQLACQENNIKPIIGETVTVKNLVSTYEVKLYCINETGWRNLLRINAAINVFNEGYVEQTELLERNEGLICIIGTDTELKVNLLKNFKNNFKDRLFFQFDCSRFVNNEKDMNRLKSLKNWFDNFKDEIPHAFIFDAYYLDQEDYEIKSILNNIGDIHNTYQSDDQYFKSSEDIKESLEPIAGANFDFLFNKGIEGAVEIAQKCEFLVDTKSKFLPVYEMDEYESKTYQTNEDLFWGLIKDGFQKKIIHSKEPKNHTIDEYIDRIKKEVEIIKEGGFIDYFLIVSDVNRWCKRNNILVGDGRGSSAGSVVSYLLDINDIDALLYDLLFERFLNPARIKTGLPDIDSDYPSSKRHLVKEYIENKYGHDYVCSIGTYTSLKIKSGFQNIASVKGVSHKKRIYYTSIYSDKDHTTFTDFFRGMADKPLFKEFHQTHYNIVELLPLLLGQPKTDSINASGVMILPKEVNGQKVDVYDLIPVKKVDDKIVTEWDKDILEKCGFLKLDVLGLSQLDKFDDIIDSIPNSEVNLLELPLNDPKVYNYFKNGWNEDVFQFGTPGLKIFCAQFKPENINDLAIINAMYRPGTLSYGGHKEYIAIKEGKKEVSYDWGLQEVTQPTLGQFVFQETIIQAVQVLGDFSLAEADEVRRAMGKKKKEVLDPYKKQFINKAIEKGCSQEEVDKIWQKIEGFASYAFNKSHALSYSKIGYYSQYLKVHYPLDFYAVSLKHAKDNEVPRRVEEIHKTGTIQLLPIDINESEFDLKLDRENNAIYWPFIRIKGMGFAKIGSLLETRKGGKFYDLNDFLHRIDASKVNKADIITLIISGAFDTIESIQHPEQRLQLIERFCKIRNLEISEEFTNQDNIYNPNWWSLQQKMISGYGMIDYANIIEGYWPDQLHYHIGEEINSDLTDKKVVTAGIILSMKEGTTKRGFSYMNMALDCNTYIMEVKLWSDFYEYNKKLLENIEGKIILVTGILKRFGNQYSVWSSRDSKFLIV